MINDAQEWLERARDGFTDPVEQKAIDELLGMPPVFVAPAINDGKAVWLFTGGISQLAIPLELMPDLTRFAREQGLLEKFYVALAEEVNAMLASVKQALEVSPA